MLTNWFHDHINACMIILLHLLYPLPDGVTTALN